MPVSMFGIPDDPVTGFVDPSELEYRHASKISIAYPRYEDWRKVYDPDDLYTRYRDQRYGPTMHQSMRRDHERSVTLQLDVIFGSDTGKAVLGELNVGPPWTVMIYPFEVAPMAEYKKMLQGGFTTAAFTTSAYRDDRSLLDPQLVGVPFCAKALNGVWTCVKATGTGKGSDVELYYSAARNADSLFSADDVLLHELVHAGRFLHGKMRGRQVGGSYGNQEEFVAQLVQNIYRSEKNRTVYDYGGAADRRGSLPDPRGARDRRRLAGAPASFFSMRFPTSRRASIRSGNSSTRRRSRVRSFNAPAPPRAGEPRTAPGARRKAVASPWRCRAAGRAARRRRIPDRRSAPQAELELVA